ncbi:hypothetical protein SUDANB95_06752 [Actinosynnema sp. ALI-1.44]
MTEPRHTTNNAGIPVAGDDHSLTPGPNGPILLQDHHLIEKNAQFNRERVPERVVHAKGGGAFGWFETTEDVSRYTKAALFQPGLRTETLLRFSTVAGERATPTRPTGFYAPNSYGGPHANAVAAGETVSAYGAEDESCARPTGCTRRTTSARRAP